MSSETCVVRVDELSKSYQIYLSPRDRLKQFIVPSFRSWLGLTDRKYYTDFVALDGISFEVGRGETVGIVGRNGSGKSTLLQIVCGTLAQSSGYTKVQGRVAALLELGAGFNPEFTGRENVSLYASILGMSGRETAEKFQSIARFADIGEFIDQPVKTYSSGMVVRLAFATAVHVSPDVLVIDEALAVGDTAFQQKCLNRIRQMQAGGVSILIVTHSTNTLIEYCDRGIYLKRGRLALDGACRDIVQAYTDDLVAEEGGINLVPRTVAEDGNSLVESVFPSEGRTEQDKAHHLPLLLAIARVLICNDTDRSVATCRYGEWFRVLLTVEARELVRHPCFGIQLASTDGIVLWSATTLAMGVSVAPIAPGSHTFSWHLQANFSGNRYVVSVGVGEVRGGEYKRTQRLDYAGHIDVLPTPGSGSGWLAPLPRFQAQREALFVESNGTVQL